MFDNSLCQALQLCQYQQHLRDFSAPLPNRHLSRLCLSQPTISLRIVDAQADHIFIVTGPVARFARQIAGQGYIVAAPSSYHEFTGPEPLAYDVPGTDAGNEWKITKVCTCSIAMIWDDISISILPSPDIHRQILLCTAPPYRYLPHEQLSSTSTYPSRKPYKSTA